MHTFAKGVYKQNTQEKQLMHTRMHIETPQSLAFDIIASVWATDVD